MKRFFDIKMRPKAGFWLLLLAFLPAAATAARPNDSVPAIGRQTTAHRSERLFATKSYENPALRQWLFDQSLTQVVLGGQWESQRESIVPQKGDGYYGGNIGATTFRLTKRGAVWGNASFEIDKITNVQFNETSDYDLLAPYIMADTVGGDLHTQIYRFGGGFALRLPKNFSIGLNATYRANIAYRQIDPRPKNLVTDLRLKLGTAYAAPNGYRIGLDVQGGRYKQTNSMKFFSELGVPNVVHLTGLGTHYYRFQGSNYETYYKGYSVGGDLGLQPQNSGWHMAIGYTFRTFEKVISTLNELPMARCNAHKFTGEIAYLQKGATFWGVKLNGDYTRCLGTENLFDDATDNIYPQIGSVQQYTYYDLTAYLSAIYGQRDEQHEWSIAPQIGYLRHNENYFFPAQNMQFNHLAAGVGGRYAATCGRWRIDAGLHGAFYADLAHNLALADSKSVWQTPFVQTFSNLSEHFAQIDARLHIGYAWRADFALFANIGYTLGLFQHAHNHTHTLEAAIGVAF